MRAFLLAAGRGVRFRPVTESIPKPLFQYLNVPLIRAHLTRLARHGILEAGVNLHHLGEKIEGHLRDRAADLPKLRLFPEAEILGTAGALRNAAGWLSGGDFLVVNTDTVIEPDIPALLARHRETGRAATLLVVENRYPNRYTPLQAEGDRITGFGMPVEKPLLYTGVCVLSPISGRRSSARRMTRSAGSSTAAPLMIWAARAISSARRSKRWTAGDRSRKAEGASTPAGGSFLTSAPETSMYSAVSSAGRRSALEHSSRTAPSGTASRSAPAPRSADVSRPAEGFFPGRATTASSSGRGRTASPSSIRCPECFTVSIPCLHANSRACVTWRFGRRRAPRPSGRVHPTDRPSPACSRPTAKTNKCPMN